MISTGVEANTALPHAAALNGNLDIVGLLIDRGADTSACRIRDHATWSSMMQSERRSSQIGEIFAS